MNKNLLNAVAVSIALHASTLGVARGGILGHGMMPEEELKRLAEQQRTAMSFTFVDSPAMQLKDEQPARKTNMISDKSTAAKDQFNGPSPMATETPHVDKVGGGKQVGRLEGTPEQPLKVAPPRPQPQAQQQQPQQKPAPPKPRPPEQAQPKPKPTVMKAEKVEEPDDAAKMSEEEKVKQEYMIKIKELQRKIDRAQEQIRENEERLKKQKEMQKEEDEFLREMEKYEKTQPRQKTPDPQQADSSRGKLGFGGSSMHDIASDVQGDVDRFGEFSFNANRYELGDYFKKMKAKVEHYWLPYLAFTYSGNSFFGNRTVVFFKIMPNGAVKGAKILEHTGDELLKEFCLSAVQATSPFEPLPEGFMKSSGYPYLPIVFTFNY